MANRVYPNNLTNPVVPLGYDGSDFRAILVDTSGKVIVNVPTLPLPAGAATAANQTTEITSLQLIDDLRDALQSVATDYLRIVGQVYGSQGLSFAQDAITGLLNAKITSSSLPAGAATLAEQQTQTANLQLIADLRNALNNVGADQLRVLAGTDGANWHSFVTNPAGFLYVMAIGDKYLVYPQDAGTGNLIVRVDSSALPAGAATAANQATEITSLQLIDDLRNALVTVATDKMRTSVIDSALPVGAATQYDQTVQTSDLDTIKLLAFALTSLGTDKLRTTVIDSALPSGAATAANQTTEITSLQLIDDLRAALASVNADSVLVAGQSAGASRVLNTDSAGRLNINTAASLPLPTGASTLAEQQTQTTSLQTIDNLSGALTSVGTDGLRIAGQFDENYQAFGVMSAYHEAASDLNPAAGPINKDLTAVTASQIWVVKNIWGLNATTAGKRINIMLELGDATLHRLATYVQTGTADAASINGEWILPAGAYVRVQFADNAAGDDLYWGANGYKMPA